MGGRRVDGGRGEGVARGEVLRFRGLRRGKVRWMRGWERVGRGDGIALVWSVIIPLYGSGRIWAEGGWRKSMAGRVLGGQGCCASIRNSCVSYLHREHLQRGWHPPTD